MKTFFAILTCFFALTGFSQNQFIGLKAGIDWSNQAGSFFKPSRYLNGFSGGVDYTLRFKNNLRTGVNLIYAQSGFKFPIYFTDELGNQLDREPNYVIYRFDYLSVPVKIGYEYGDKWFVYGDLGLATSFLLHAKITEPIFNENLEKVGESEHNLTDKLASVELAGFFETGFGYSVLKKIDIFAEGNYYHSFTRFTSANFFPDYRQLNYRLSVNLGIRYKLR